MYPNHRRAVLEEVRKRLNENSVCRVVSTSLIEAGVDVDFPAVYRSEAGLDSVIQAAGRCNREGKQATGTVFVFRPEEAYLSGLPAMLKRPMEVARSISDRFEDSTSPEAITEYFKQLYRMEGDNLDVKRIVHRLEVGLERNLSFPFADVAKNFHLIDNETYPVIINRTDESRELVYSLLKGVRTISLLRSTQQFTVSVYRQSYEALCGIGAVEPIDSELSLLKDHSRYSDAIGLNVAAESGDAVFS